ncbi:MAG: hypothetical protein P4L66_13195 [Acetobacteraceae bacterium]|nr:hypothetical protein [Acetobacteraceae bacterium]
MCNNTEQPTLGHDVDHVILHDTGQIESGLDGTREHAGIVERHLPLHAQPPLSHALFQLPRLKPASDWRLQIAAAAYIGL